MTERKKDFCNQQQAWPSCCLTSQDWLGSFWFNNLLQYWWPTYVLWVCYSCFFLRERLLHLVWNNPKINTGKTEAMLWLCYASKLQAQIQGAPFKEEQQVGLLSCGSFGYSYTSLVPTQSPLSLGTTSFSYTSSAIIHWRVLPAQTGGGERTETVGSAVLHSGE